MEKDCEVTKKVVQQLKSSYFSAKFIPIIKDEIRNHKRT